MEKPQKTEEEQRAFFYLCYESFLTAKDAAGEVTHSFRIGGTTVRLLFAGQTLVPHIIPALEHVRTADTDRPDLTLCIWDSDTTATKMVPPPCPWESFTDRGDIWGFHSTRIKTAFHWIECSLNLMDLRENLGIFWVQTAETLPFWVHASPLRTLLHWWMEKNGCQLLHAAAVGTAQGAVLITGKGGVGKSTAALSCLQSGLFYLADDYAVARLGPEPRVFSLYSTAKLNADHVKKFPGLSGMVNNPEKLDQEKAVMFLHPALDKQLLSEMPLRAILMPRVSDRDESRIAPAPAWTIQKAMSFTTLSQLPYVNRSTHDYITRLSETLPGYVLESGRDLNDISRAVSDLLADLSRRVAVSGHQPGFSRGICSLVSVIIPVYNGQRFIAEAVKNIAAQNYPALEIIVVDDGSTDRTGEIVAGLPVDIRYFKQENAGPASARNRGIRDASGDFIMFLDVDDLWPDNTVNSMVDEMQREPEREVIRGYAQMMRFNAATAEYDPLGNPRESYPHYIGAAIYRKSVFKKVGLFDPTLRFAEDTDWYTRAAEQKVNIKRVDEITLLVRRHGSNMTYGKNLIELNTLKVFKKSLDRMRGAGA